MNPKVDDYIASQEIEKQKLLKYLRGIILEHAPGIEERFLYKIPFYYFNNKPLCYLLPVKKGLNIGFYYGFKMATRPGFLEPKGRKQVKLIQLSTLDDFNRELFGEVLSEAMIINENIPD